MPTKSWSSARVTPRASRARSAFENACKLGLEGIISKRRDAPYRSGRDPNWRKIKCQGSERR
jgi:ATP-dependent DNA ligase